MRGKFIVVDGGEGSGKGTCIERLQKVLSPDQNIFTREPGGTLVSEEIRRLLKSDANAGSNALTNFLLFWAARSDLAENVIRPTLNAGRNVITDRYDMSTFAYQIRGQENGDLEDLFYRLRFMIGLDIRPDLYIYLDVDPEEGSRRTAGRGDQDHFDRRSMDFHHRVRNGYLEFVRKHEGVVISTTNRSIESVSAEFEFIVRGCLSAEPLQLVLEPA